jgi:hypothetical protein
VVAAEREHAKAAQKVEIALPVGVEQIGALGGQVVNVEPENSQDPQGLGVEMLLEQPEPVRPTLCNQRLQIERHAIPPGDPWRRLERSGTDLIRKSRSRGGAADQTGLEELQETRLLPEVIARDLVSRPFFSACRSNCISWQTIAGRSDELQARRSAHGQKKSRRLFAGPDWLVVDAASSRCLQRRRVDIGKRDLIQLLVRRLLLFQRLVQEVCRLLVTAGFRERTD